MPWSPRLHHRISLTHRPQQNQQQKGSKQAVCLTVWVSILSLGDKLWELGQVTELLCVTIFSPKQ